MSRLWMWDEPICASSVFACSTGVNNTPLTLPCFLGWGGLKQTRPRLTRRLIYLNSHMWHLACILAGFTCHYSSACTRHKDKYTAKSHHCTGALNGCIAYFAPLLKRTWIVWGSRRSPPQQGLIGGGGGGLKATPLCLLPLYSSEESISEEL